ncbi:methyltransferase type 11 [Streptomyces viridochromogenes]|uniref:Methyltransferase type 11 n=1 Tax=Streptomyces viridochromogenes TaxID=1938 RepID=A0A0J7ZKP5_STRVR|nr:class I SAM-dependent methyltransferase [Streptomyces viridochromogenes]KMS76484.1 methyltransferase type 11 [Streptomyces viridochromogenes]KOG23261.1 methyltransferase type 11 [Streptomyces viridochromogenes]KOG27135.1 methyltransferase type 11 [Streptomyces viridochromogenes]
MTHDGPADHLEQNRRFWDDEAAAWHAPLARDHWSRTEPSWGLWATPEPQVTVLPDGIAGMRTIELGCGTAYVSAWLARAGAQPVGIDLSEQQLATARAMQEEFGLDFPLVLGNAEKVPYEDDSFDLAISEYGASLWCDPYRWIPEAARLLVPGGRLVFMRYSPLFALCASPEGAASTRLFREQFGLTRLEWGNHVQFILPHGEMLRLLRSCGFVVEDLIEVQAPRPAHRDYAEVSADWAHQWPSEEIWKARLAG